MPPAIPATTASRRRATRSRPAGVYGGSTRHRARPTDEVLPSDLTRAGLRAFFATNPPLDAVVARFVHTATMPAAVSRRMQGRIVDALLDGAGAAPVGLANAVACVLHEGSAIAGELVAERPEAAPALRALLAATLADAPWPFVIPRDAFEQVLDDLPAALTPLAESLRAERWAWLLGRLAQTDGPLPPALLDRIHPWFDETTPIAVFRAVLPHLPRAVRAADPFGPADPLVAGYLDHAAAAPRDWAAVLAHATGAAARWAIAQRYLLGSAWPPLRVLGDPATQATVLAAAADSVAARPLQDAEPTTLPPLLDLTLVTGIRAQWATCCARLAEVRGAWRSPVRSPDVDDVPDVQQLLQAWWEAHGDALTPDDIAPLLQSQCAPLRLWVTTRLGDLVAATPAPAASRRRRPT